MEKNSMLGKWIYLPRFFNGVKSVQTIKQQVSLDFHSSLQNEKKLKIDKVIENSKGAELQKTLYIMSTFITSEAIVASVSYLWVLTNTISERLERSRRFISYENNDTPFMSTFFFYYDALFTDLNLVFTLFWFSGFDDFGVIILISFSRYRDIQWESYEH